QRGVFAAAELGTPDGVWILPEQLQLDHGRKITFCWAAARHSTRRGGHTKATIFTLRGEPVRIEPMPDMPNDLEDEVPVASSRAEEAEQPLAGFRWPRTLQPTATRRALLLTALGALLIAGLVTAIPAVGTGPGRLTGYIDSNPVPSTGGRSNPSFS